VEVMMKLHSHLDRHEVLSCTPMLIRQLNNSQVICSLLLPLLLLLLPGLR
jgi:hypothetical protein